MKVNNNVPECLKGVKFERKLINVTKLHASLKGIQRSVDMVRVQQIAHDWIPNFNQDPIVGFNTETKEYVLPSGQHTTQAYLWRVQNGLEDKVTLICRVAENLTEEQLNAIFAYEATMSKSQSSRSVINGLWNSNNKDLHKIQQVIEKYGYTLSCNKDAGVVINSTGLLLDMDIVDLEKCIQFISIVFPYNLKVGKQYPNKKAVEATFIKAVKVFLNIWGRNDNFNIVKLKNAILVSESNATKLIKEAKDIKQYDKHPTRQIAYLIAKIYNNSVRKDKLRFSELDDYFTA